jgi:hypothetical protein
MDAYLLDWLNLLLRWLHLIAGIAWIGASFYFVMLDNSLSAPKKTADRERGVFGELWAVHGGGFYVSQKFLTGPKGEPLADNLHWSKWEAYHHMAVGNGTPREHLRVWRGDVAHRQECARHLARRRCRDQHRRDRRRLVRL